MKILHTADWHLGKKLDAHSRLEEQREAMEEICSIADREKADLVLVAGDLFDTFNPPTEAIELLYKTLRRLTRNGERPVIAIAGNHDSPDRIAAPDPLAREAGIIMIGHPQAEVRPFALPDFSVIQSDKGFIELKLNAVDFPIRILHTAYANETRLKEYFGEDKAEGLNAVLQKHWNETAAKYCTNEGVNLLITHLYMMRKGGDFIPEPDGEKPLQVGAAEAVFSDFIPKEIQYTALGHLHNWQNVGTEEQPAIYASSPLQYSFSEAGKQKYVALIEAQPHQPVQVEKIALKSGKQLVRKHFSSTEEAVHWLHENPNTLIELTLESDTYLTAADRKQLYDAHSGIIYLIPKIKNRTLENPQSTTADLSRDIHLIFEDYFKYKHGQEPNDEIKNLFNEILHS